MAMAKLDSTGTMLPASPVAGVMLGVAELPVPGLVVLLLEGEVLLEPMVWLELAGLGSITGA